MIANAYAIIKAEKNLLLNNPNNEILELSKDGTLDIKKLHSLLESRSNSLNEIGSEIGKDGFTLGTSNGDSILFWLGDDNFFMSPI